MTIHCQFNARYCYQFNTFVGLFLSRYSSRFKRFLVAVTLITPILVLTSMSASADVDVDDDGLIEIANFAELDAMRDDLAGNSLSGDNTGCPTDGCNGYELANDIDFADDDGTFSDPVLGWQPIGDADNPFTGTFNGNGQAIKNLLINQDSAAVGFFRYAENAILLDVHLTGSVTGTDQVGALLGNALAGTSITACTSTASVAASTGNSAGGLVGVITASTITGSAATGPVTGGDNVGGLVGLVDSTEISDSSAAGAVSGVSRIGGLLGHTRNGSIVLDSKATGAVVSTGNNIGGFIGFAASTQISNSFAMGDVSGGGNNSGGFVGLTDSTTIGTTDTATPVTIITDSYATGAVSGDINNTGGFGGLFRNGTIVEGAFSVGEVVGNGINVGGFVGRVSNSRIRAIFSTGSVTGSNNVAGLVGNGTPSATIDCNFSTGAVASNGTGVRLGGLVGQVNATTTIEKSYWATDTSGQGDLHGRGDLVIGGGGNAGVPLEALKCPTSANDTGCGSDSLYVDWQTCLDEGGNEYWDFGTDLQLPALVLRGIILRDGDTDGDGVDDIFDAFPNDPDEQTDSDGDGTGDNEDKFDDDPNEQLDDDHDGIGNNRDIDFDNNGLIELYSLADLDKVRDDLHGTSLSGDTVGCPSHGCNGYELMGDLDFDTNSDGLINADDDFWNEGAGWLPIGDDAAAFKAIFEGNGFVIMNLYIDRESTSSVGLFGNVSWAKIRYLGLTGELTSVRGGNRVGALAGLTQESTKVLGCYNDNGLIQGKDDVGGLIGYSRATHITASFTTGLVIGDNNVGGLLGRAVTTLTAASFSTASVAGEDRVGGVVGSSTVFSAFVATYATGSVIANGAKAGGVGGKLKKAFLISNHFATDLTGQSELYGAGGFNFEESSNLGATLIELQCPVAANDKICVGTRIYHGWGIFHDHDGNDFWDFGSEQALPGLNLQGEVFRDSDGDGYLDGTPTSSVGGRVTAVDGSALEGVSVKALVGGKLLRMAKSDANGQFDLTVFADTDVVLVFNQPGYAAQIVPARSPALDGIVFLDDIRMLALGAEQTFDAGVGGTFSGADGAEVLVQANSFVDADGNLVTGAITLTVTPVDVSRPATLAAFPGAFSGVFEGDTQDSAIASLGTVEFEFTQDGQALQLADGATADILIPIYLANYPNGEAILPGQLIPLWSLNEETGIWLQEGFGTVELSQDSPTGLALSAQVSHFSWWNCDVSLNPARAIVTVNGIAGGTARVRATTNANIGWRPTTVDTVVATNAPTNPLFIPSNARVCFTADILFGSGATQLSIGITNEICIDPTEEGENYEIVLTQIDVDQFKLLTLPQPEEDALELSLLAFLNFPVEAVRLIPNTNQATVDFSIVEGVLPGGLELKVVNQLSAEIVGAPSETGDFRVTIEASAADGSTDSVTINYRVVDDVPPPNLLGNRFFGEGGESDFSLESFIFIGVTGDEDAIIDLNTFNIGGPAVSWSLIEFVDEGPTLSVSLNEETGQLTVPVSGQFSGFRGELTASNGSGSSTRRIEIDLFFQEF